MTRPEEMTGQAALTLLPSSTIAASTATEGSERATFVSSTGCAVPAKSSLKYYLGLVSHARKASRCFSIARRAFSRSPDSIPAAIALCARGIARMS